MKLLAALLKGVSVLLFLSGEPDLFIVTLPLVITISVLASAGKGGIFHSGDSFGYSDQLFQQQMQENMHRENNDRFMRDMMNESMNESLKSVTPWEHGGYDMNQGNSFNDHSFFN